jgi:hypothetical protein
VSQDRCRRLALLLSKTFNQRQCRAKIFPAMGWAALGKIGDCFECVVSIGDQLTKGHK